MPKYPNLKALMIQHGISQNELARLLEIHKSSMSYKLNRKVPFTINEIEKILTLFNRPFEYVFFTYKCVKMAQKSTQDIICENSQNENS